MRPRPLPRMSSPRLGVGSLGLATSLLFCPSECLSVDFDSEWILANSFFGVCSAFADEVEWDFLVEPDFSVESDFVRGEEEDFLADDCSGDDRTSSFGFLETDSLLSDFRFFLLATGLVELLDPK